MNCRGNSIKGATKAWDGRADNPIEAAKAIASLSDIGMNNHNIALVLGARSGEVVLYQDLASLDPSALKIIIDKGLPIGFAVELAHEPEERQVKALDLYLQNGGKHSDPYAALGAVIRKLMAKEGVTVATLTGSYLMHLASKAKQYNALSGKSRKALFEMGRNMRWGLSEKQQRYADTLLKKLEEAGVLTAPCGKDSCKLCEGIRNLLEGS